MSRRDSTAGGAYTALHVCVLLLTRSIVAYIQTNVHATGKSVFYPSVTAEKSLRGKRQVTCPPLRYQLNPSGRPPAAGGN